MFEYGVSLLSYTVESIMVKQKPPLNVVGDVHGRITFLIVSTNLLSVHCLIACWDHCMLRVITHIIQLWWNNHIID